MPSLSVAEEHQVWAVACIEALSRQVQHLSDAPAVMNGIDRVGIIRVEPTLKFLDQSRQLKVALVVAVVVLVLNLREGSGSG